ncbi:MAG TPA: type II toxin-antitoxin system VapB family antitoxin [Caulobacteraceae bacterium]|nr:type II toxin-antitoxin system VapB family antitoxin [Caulobacteraceae bacterium]
MALNIKDPTAEKSARELAAATGEGLTLAIRKAVEERLARVRRDRGGRDTAAELLAIGAHCAALPDIDPRSADEILGYDEHGLPT